MNILNHTLTLFLYHIVTVIFICHFLILFPFIAETDLFARKESSWRIAMSKASGKSSSVQSRDSESQTDETQIEDK